MKNTKTSRSEGRSRTQPSAIVHLIPLLSPAVAPVAGKGAEALLKYLQSAEAVGVQVLDSKQTGDHHQIQFKVTNNTLNGAYIESADLLQPGGGGRFNCAGDRSQSNTGLSLSDPTPREPIPLFPKLLSPGSEMVFDLEFPVGDKTRKMKWDMAGQLEIIISRLDQSKPDKKNVTFRVRWDGA